MLRRVIRPLPCATICGRLAICGCLAWGAAAGGGEDRANVPAPATDAAGLEFFETHVRPLLADACVECHGPDLQQGGVRLDTRAGMFAAGEDGGEIGPAVIPGDAAGSRLLEVLAHADDDLGMPPEGKLPDDRIAVLTAWVERGAPWPEEAARPVPAADPAAHWAFRPVVRPPVPDVAGATPVDRFLNAKLTAAGIEPAGAAPRRTQIRRLYLDLLGVPPTWDELQTALADLSAEDGRPDAWPRLVERVLADPRHGPRWARHWLDVARYADTTGYVGGNRSTRYPFAWTYRDWVADAFNRNLPFDRFVTLQLAADRLGLAADDPDLAAMGFLTLGDRFLNNPVLIADDRVDVASRGLLGLTVACARCHDHKYDPVPTEDYYALYGVFRSSVAPDELPVVGAVPDTPAGRAFVAERDRLSAAAATVDAELLDTVRRDLRDRFGDHLAAAAGVAPKDGLRSHAVRVFRKRLAKADADDPVLGRWVALRDGASDEAPAAVAAEFNAAAAEWGDRPPGDPLRTIVKGWTQIEPRVLRGYLNQAERKRSDAAAAKLTAFLADSPAAPPRAHVLHDRSRREWNTVFVRGDTSRRGKEIVPHAVPSILTGGELVEVCPDGVSGRAELAAAIVDPANPLTARVFVNRVWAWRFGTGLVTTPSDFGTRADPPSHPALLDWLADGFVRSGWDVKALHRRIVGSDAYRRGAGPAAGDARDPGNRLLSRFPRRRLSFEALRDAALAAAGVLDERIGGRPADLFDRAAPHRRRTLYGIVDRNDPPGAPRNFDFPSPDATADARTETAVPQQGLYALNGPDLAAWGAALAASLPPGDPVAPLYRRVLLRDPTAAERDRAERFLASAGADGAALLAHVLLMSNEFSYLE